MDSKNTLYAYRGVYRKKVIYLDKDAKTKINMDASGWADTDSIASASWEVENSDTSITITHVLGVMKFGAQTLTVTVV